MPNSLEFSGKKCSSVSFHRLLPSESEWTLSGSFTLYFRSFAQLVVRVTFCALLIDTLDGPLNLPVGYAVLKAAKYISYTGNRIAQWNPRES